MIWENNVKLITMLCPLGTEEKEESTEYWLPLFSEDKVTQRINVKEINLTTPISGVKKREIVITDGIEERSLIHL